VHEGVVAKIDVGAHEAASSRSISLNPLGAALLTRRIRILN